MNNLFKQSLKTLSKSKNTYNAPSRMVFNKSQVLCQIPKFNFGVAQTSGAAVSHLDAILSSDTLLQQMY